MRKELRGGLPRTAEAAPHESAPVPRDDGLRLSLMLLSDLHITDNAETAAKLHMALRDLSHFTPVPDALVLGGDLVDSGRQQDYERLARILHQYSLPPVYGLMGNHEYYSVWYDANGDWSRETMPNGQRDAEARERFRRFMAYPEKPYHDVWVKGIHLIFLSQEAYQQELPWVGEGAWYSDDQLNWLREVVKAHGDGAPALVFIHQPLPPPGQEGGAQEMVRAREFYDILRPYPNVFVFSGHTHVSLAVPGRYSQWGSIHWLQNGSVGRTFSQGSAVSNSVQGLFIEVYQDRVEVRGREFSTRSWIPAAHWSVPLQ